MYIDNRRIHKTFQHPPRKMITHILITTIIAYDAHVYSGRAFLPIKHDT